MSGVVICFISLFICFFPGFLVKSLQVKSHLSNSKGGGDLLAGKQGHSQFVMHLSQMCLSGRTSKSGL